MPRLQEESGASNNLRIEEVELKIVEEESPSRQETPAKDDDLTTISMITAEIETLYKDLEREEKMLKVSTECQTQGRIVEKKEITKESYSSQIEPNNYIAAEISREQLDNRKDVIREENDKKEIDIVESFVVKEEKKVEPEVINKVEVTVKDVSPQRQTKIVVVNETIVETNQERKPKPEEVEIINETVTQTNTIEMRIHEEKEVMEPVLTEKLDHLTKVTFKEPDESEIYIIREPSVTSSIETYQSESLEKEEEQAPLQVYTKSYTIEEPLMIVESPQKPVPATFPRRCEGVTAFEIKYKQLKDGSEPRYSLQRRRSLKEKERKEFMQRAVNLDRSQSVDIRRNLDEEFESYNYYNNSTNNGEKRRSVKEIIDSINRNQSLLQATNYTPLNGKYDYNNVATTTNTSNKPIVPPRTEPIAQLLGNVELRHPSQNGGRGSYYDNVPEMLEQLDEQASSFEKCTPRKSNGSEKYEWNPVPKPRRSRNFSEEREPPRSEALKDYY